MGKSDFGPLRNLSSKPGARPLGLVETGRKNRIGGKKTDTKKDVVLVKVNDSEGNGH